MPRTKPSTRLECVSVFVLFPIGYILYAITVAGHVTLTGYSVYVSWQRMTVIAAVLGELGLFSLLLWRRHRRLAPVACIVGLLGIPILYDAAPGSSVVERPLFAVFVVFVTLATVEFANANYDGIRTISLSTTGRVAVAVGFLHVGLAVVLQVVSRSVGSLVLLPLLAVPLLATLLFLVTAASVVLWLRSAVYSPLLVVTGWAALGTYGTVTMEKRAGFFQGISWFYPSLSPDYLLSTGMLIAFVGLLYLTEVRFRGGQALESSR